MKVSLIEENNMFTEIEKWIWLLKKIYKVFHQREYRPNKYFRIPIYFIWIRYTIRAKHPFFFSAINPGVCGLGFLDESKTETYKLLDKKYYPHGIIVELPLSRGDIEYIVQKNNLDYPIIIKPDGESVQGNNVYKISNAHEWKRYLRILPIGNYLIQEYITGEEYSIYYYRYPHHSKGNILGITKKIYPTLVGDGVSTIEELIQQHDRYHRYFHLFRDKYHVEMSQIIPSGVSKQIATIGNHCKWCLFLDRSLHSSENLRKHIDQLFQSNSGLYLFRLDIKAPSRDQVLQWKFKVIESNNGVFAEPTYMYDPDYKLINAYRQVAKIRYHGYMIAIYNHEKNKVSYSKFQEWWSYILKYLKK